MKRSRPSFVRTALWPEVLLDLAPICIMKSGFSGWIAQAL